MKHVHSKLASAIASVLALTASAVAAGFHLNLRDSQYDHGGFLNLRVSYYDYYKNLSPSRKESIVSNLRHFAQGVYEATNGAHRIYNINLYTNGQYSNNTDVLWTSECWPNAHVTGRNKPGSRIQHCDVFPNNAKFIYQPRAGGYTLTHEWGHFAYGLLDEYMDANGNNIGNTAYSLMNSQWRAIGPNDTMGDLRALNFSTAININQSSVQYQTYKRSAWETLLLDPAQDSTGWGRTRYEDLVSYAPQSGFNPSLEINKKVNADKAVENLNVYFYNDSGQQCENYWNGGIIPGGCDASRALRAADQVTRLKCFLIDHSSEVTPVQLAEFKAGVEQLIAEAKDGDSIAVAVFDHDATVVVPATVVSGDSGRQSLIQNVRKITPGAGLPALGDTLRATLDTLGDWASGASLFVFASGHAGNTAIPPLLGELQARNMEVNAFSPATDTTIVTTLQQLAAKTRGEYRQTSNTGDVFEAIEQANLTASPEVDSILASDDLTVNGTQDIPFYVETGLATAKLTLAYSGAADSAHFTLVDPNQGQRALTQGECGDVIQEAEGGLAQENFCTARISNPVAGQWTLRVATTGSVALAYAVDAEPLDNNDTIFANVEYVPQTGKIVASAGRDFSMTNLAVTAKITAVDGTSQTVTLGDDGVALDALASDGQYTSGALVDTPPGRYRIRVQFDDRAGQGKVTTIGPAFTLDPEGHTPDVTVTDSPRKFVRVATTQAVITGMKSDYERVMNWGEAMNPGLLSTLGKRELDSPPFKARYYPATDTYLGYNTTDGMLYIYNQKLFGSDIRLLGNPADFVSSARQAGF